MAQRGRPRKQVVNVDEEDKKAWQVIAEVLAQNCGIPGCSTKHHNQEAAVVIQALAEEGYKIEKV